MNLKYITLGMLALLFNGCVSSSSYFEKVDENKSLQSEIRSLQYINTQNARLRNSIDELNEKITEKENKLFNANNALTSLNNQYQNLLAEHQKMTARNNDLLEKAFQERTSLTQDLVAKQVIINEKDKQIRRLEQRWSEERNSALKTQGTGAPDAEYTDFGRHQSIEKITPISDSVKNILKVHPVESYFLVMEAGHFTIAINPDMLFDKQEGSWTKAGKATMESFAKILASCGDVIVTMEVFQTDETDFATWKSGAESLISVFEVFVESVSPSKMRICLNKQPEQAIQANSPAKMQHGWIRITVISDQPN